MDSSAIKGTGLAAFQVLFALAQAWLIYLVYSVWSLHVPLDVSYARTLNQCRDAFIAYQSADFQVLQG